MLGNQCHVIFVSSFERGCFVNVRSVSLVLFS